MSIDDKVCVGYWDVAPDDFLADDRQNPARNAAAAIIRAIGIEHGGIRLAEVGPGPGFDFIDHFRPALGRSISQYVAYEASQGMADRLRTCLPGSGACVEHGGFDQLAHLAPGAFDVVYTKATLEHQPDFRAPLDVLITAARYLLVVNFYLVPGEVEEKCYDEVQHMWYNRYAARDIERACYARRRNLCVVDVPGSSNVLYLVGGKW